MLAGSCCPSRAMAAPTVQNASPQRDPRVTVPLGLSQRLRQCSEQPWRDEIFAVEPQLRDAENCQTPPSATTSVMDMVASEQA